MPFGEHAARGCNVGQSVLREDLRTCIFCPAPTCFKGALVFFFFSFFLCPGHAHVAPVTFELWHDHFSQPFAGDKESQVAVSSVGQHFTVTLTRLETVTSGGRWGGDSMLHNLENERKRGRQRTSSVLMLFLHCSHHKTWSKHLMVLIAGIVHGVSPDNVC